MTGSGLLFGRNAALTSLIILKMSWLISLFLSLWTVSNSLMCSPAIVFYSLSHFFLSLILSFSHSFSLCHSSGPVSQSLICINPFHKQTHTHTHTQLHHPTRPDSWSLSLISSLVQSYACSSCPCSPPQHADQSWVSWSSMAAFKAVPALLFKS